MPIYVYECEACENRFEFMQSIHDPPKTVCEACGGKLSKVIVPIAFHLKGGGWYKDLYASPKSGGDGKSEGKTETKSETKGETKSESKGESKPASSSGDGSK